MNVLFIIPDHFPDTGACTNLLNHLFFQGKLAESMNQFSVLAISSKYTPTDRISYKGITIFYARLWERFSMQEYKQLLGKAPWNVLRGCGQKVLNKFVQHCHPQAIHSNTVVTIQQALIQCNAEEFDVIVPVMGSPEIAAAALNIKKKKKSGIKMVVYQVDPCTTNDALPIQTKREQTEFEKELYTYSDRIITTPILLEEAKERYYPEILQKIIPMEFPNVDPQLSQNSNIQKSAIFCRFIGSIYGKIRDPKYTLRLFENLDDRIRLEMIGALCNEAKSVCAQSGIVCSGPKSIIHVQQDFLESDILVNIGNSMRNQVPSKLFEYISYGKPIVNICKNRDCPTLRYLRDYPYVLNLFEEDDLLEEQRAALKTFILQNYRKQVAPETIRDTYAACTPEFCAEQILRVFDSLFEHI